MMSFGLSPAVELYGCAARPLSVSHGLPCARTDPVRPKPVSHLRWFRARLPRGELPRTSFRPRPRRAGQSRRAFRLACVGLRLHQPCVCVTGQRISHAPDDTVVRSLLNFAGFLKIRPRLRQRWGPLWCHLPSPSTCSTCSACSACCHSGTCDLRGGSVRSIQLWHLFFAA